MNIKSFFANIMLDKAIKYPSKAEETLDAANKLLDKGLVSEATVSELKSVLCVNDSEKAV